MLRLMTDYERLSGNRRPRAGFNLSRFTVGGQFRHAEICQHSKINAGLGGPGPHPCYSRFTVGEQFWHRLSATFINFMLKTGLWAGVGGPALTARFTVGR